MDRSGGRDHRYVHGSERRSGVRGEQLVTRGTPALRHDAAAHRPWEQRVRSCSLHT